jgi:hypothetical protein
MVFFICETCQETLRKKQIERHCQSACRGAWVFTCIDCNKGFEGYEYEAHTECITESQKYHGKFAKPVKSKTPPAVLPPATELPAKRPRPTWKGWKNEIKAELKAAGEKGVRASDLRDQLVSKYMEAIESKDLEGAQDIFAAKVRSRQIHNKKFRQVREGRKLRLVYFRLAN